MKVEDYVNPTIDILFGEEKEPEWLVPDMMLRGELTLLAGEPGAGKSLLTYTWALAMAGGVGGFGGIIPASKPMTVVYFDNENSEGNRNKYMTWAWHGLMDNHGQDNEVVFNVSEHFKPVHFILGVPDWEETATEYVQFFKPDLIVFDTAISCCAAEDENSNAEAGLHVAGIRRVMRSVEPVAAALVLKHAKRGEQRIRGATVWESLADQTMFQVRRPGRPRKDGLSLTQLKPGKHRAFGLHKKVYITPSFTDAKRRGPGLVLDASYKQNREHQAIGDEDDE